MTFQDMQNAVLQRLRQRGVNFGGTAAGSATDFDPPYAVKMYLNTAYNEFLSRTQQNPIASIKVSFPTTLNAQSYGLNPIPANGGVINPAALRVYEITYTQAGAQERYIEGVSSPRFRALTGNYVRRFGNNGPIPRYWAQEFGLRTLDLWPGTSTAGDLISATITPDPQSSPANCPCSNGGAMVNDADVPLIPPQFHIGLVSYALGQMFDAGTQFAQRDNALQQWEQKIQEALDFGSATGEGDAEQVVTDFWSAGAAWP